MSRPTFPFNVIETKYHGYRFRSRLEARWATFFDALSLEYRYEPEGYSLEGTHYLPDFYFPQHDCFIEIKGRQPTLEEKEKARLLALYTGKNVYTLFGDLWLPHEPISYNVYLDTPPEIYTYLEGSNFGEGFTRKVDAQRDTKIMLQKLYDQNIIVDVRHGLVTLHSMYTFSPHEYGIANYLALLQKQHDEISYLSPLIKEYDRDIVRSLTPMIGWKCEFYGQAVRSDYAWAECSGCSDVTLIPKLSKGAFIEEELKHRHCGGKKQGSYVYDSSMLKEAYKAARQARFEAREERERGFAM